MCEKERLLDELADFLDSVTEENFDVERLDALLNALDRVDPIPSQIIPPAEKSLQAFWERFTNK